MIENGLPTGNIYEYAALMVLRYEKKLRTQSKKVINKALPSMDNLSFDHGGKSEQSALSTPVPGSSSKVMMKEEDKKVTKKSTKTEEEKTDLKSNRLPRADVNQSVDSSKNVSARPRDLELKSPKMPSNLSSRNRESSKQLKN